MVGVGFSDLLSVFQTYRMLSVTLTYKVMSNTLTYLLLTNTLCVVSLTYQVMSDTLKLTVHFLTRWSGSRRFAPTRFHQPISEKNTSSFLMLKTENKIILNIHVHVHCTY